MNMHKNQERGIALVLALILMSAMSVLAASMMFLSQTETYASMNYRMMSQARYAAEAGVQKASDFLLDPAKYAVPIAPSDPLFTTCNRTASPVLCGGNPVVLSSGVSAPACQSHASNYPTASVVTAFNAAAQGSMTSGNASVNYCAYATLTTIQVFDSYGGSQNVVLTWEITGVGSLGSTRPATVEVVAIVEQLKVPANNYAAFATDNTCGALTFDGGAQTDSYDSTSLNPAVVAPPTMDHEGGDVGTNGNLNISNNVDVYGNLYTPRTGVGSCSEGSVTAITEDGHATVHGGIVPLPTAVVYPTPTIPAHSTLPLVDINHVAGACALLGLMIANCTESGDNIIINGLGTQLSMPSIKLSGTHVNIQLVASNLPPAQYNFNSIELTSNASIGVKATTPLQGVLVNVVGKNAAGTNMATAIDFTGGGNTAVVGCPTCSPFDASMLQFVYGGSGEIKLAGHAAAAAVFYAPNSEVVFSGTSDLYGSILASRLRETGNGKIHYDRRLARDFYVAGHPMVGTFSWKRY
jgi:Tfp pilus assembly protein PilX